MQNIKAVDLFKNMNNINISEFENSKNINLDFSNINNIDLKSITTLLDIQKVALLNNKTLTVSNVSENVNQMLDVTGLNKTFANLATNPITRK